jgi:acyl-CoA thioesterase-1
MNTLYAQTLIRQNATGLIIALIALAGTIVSAQPVSSRIVFLGDSLTAGYGLDADQAYPAVIAGKLRAAGHAFDVVNSGVSGDTTAGGLRRLNWLMRQPIAVLVIALGANDGLRGFAPSVTEANLDAMINRVRTESPDTRILLAGMKLPYNMGPDYVDAFAAIYPRVASRHNLPLIPFLLEGVAAEPELNLPDGIHPNSRGQQILARTIWTYLEPILHTMPETNLKHTVPSE